MEPAECSFYVSSGACTYTAVLDLIALQEAWELPCVLRTKRPSAHLRSFCIHASCFGFLRVYNSGLGRRSIWRYYYGTPTAPQTPRGPRTSNFLVYRLPHVRTPHCFRFQHRFLRGSCHVFHANGIPPDLVFPLYAPRGFQE